MSTPSQKPGRVVDRDNYGWYRASDGQGSSVYCVDYRTRSPDYATLEATRGPLRPVLSVDDGDIAELDRLFAMAGRRAVTSLAAAIESVVNQIRETAWARYPVDASTSSYEYAMRTLKAGRAGSWESALLQDVVFFGEDLNLNRKAARHDVAAMRAAGPGRRVHRKARDKMAAVITRWVTDPDRYTEVAETLAYIVSSYADQHGPDGWRMIADQWLQSSAFGGGGFRACYRLLYSRSEHYDPSLA
jgi:hypothetical protein